MLVSFTIDPDVFELPSNNLDIKSRHMELIRLWRQYGMLIIPGNNNEDARLYKAIMDSPQSIRTLWQHALRHNRKRIGAPQIAAILESNNPVFSGLGSDSINLVSLEETRGLVWGLNENDFSKKLDCSVEICRFGHEKHSTTFQEAENLSTFSIKEGENPGAVWHARLSSLIDASRTINIIDRYAFVEHFSCKGKRQTSGLERFLMKTANAAGLKKIIHIFSSFSIANNKINGREINFESACNELLCELKSICAPLRSKKILEININIAPDSSYGNVVHYRYIRFDDHNLLEFDTGLEPFGGDSVYRTCTVKAYCWQGEEASEFVKNEKILRNLVKRQEKISLGE